jgi:protease I
MKKKIAILATNGFEESELKSPKEALEKQDWTVHVISPESDSIKGWSDGDWSGSVDVDYTLDEILADDYDALVLPGGVLNPDKLRTDKKAIAFVQHFFEEKKPVSAICHGPQVLISAGVVSGRTMTSVEAVKVDLENAGVNWVDAAVVCDMGLVTSRTPADLPEFNTKTIEEIKEGKHVGREA